jgi:hypothetical protein
MQPSPALTRSPQQAARAIIELINSRPSSPQQHEIAAIIEATVAAPAIRAPSAPRVSKGLAQEYGPDISAHRN